VYAEGPGLVRRGADHASSAETTDDNRPPAEFGPVALLDGRVKGVHVDVQDMKRAVGHRNDPADTQMSVVKMDGKEKLSLRD
jgi:hypothetical protein